MSSDSEVEIIAMASQVVAPASRQPRNGSASNGPLSTADEYPNRFQGSTNGSGSVYPAPGVASGTMLQRKASAVIEIVDSSDEDALPDMRFASRATGKQKAVVPSVDRYGLYDAAQAPPPAVVAKPVPVAAKVPKKRSKVADNPPVAHTARAVALQRNSANHGPSVSLPPRPAILERSGIQDPPAKKAKRAAKVIEDDDDEDGDDARRNGKKVTKRAKAGEGDPSSPDPATRKKAAIAKKKSDELEAKSAKIAHNSANILQHNRKKTVSELVVRLSGTAFAPEQELDALGQRRHRSTKSIWVKIGRELKERMAAFDCVVETPERPRIDLHCDGAVRWTRICDRRWDSVNGYFVALPSGATINAEEDTRLIFMTATELAMHIEDGTLLSHMYTVTALFPSQSSLIMMIYGLESHFSEIQASSDEKHAILLMIERAQVDTKCFVIRVEKVGDAVDWLEQLSMDVGAKHYQRIKKSYSLILGVDAQDSIASGSGEADTYVKMLSAIEGITTSVAEGIGKIYPTLRSLYEAYTASSGEKARAELLIGVQKIQNKDGTASNRMVGAVLSERIYQVLCE